MNGMEILLFSEFILLKFRSVPVTSGLIPTPAYCVEPISLLQGVFIVSGKDALARGVPCFFQDRERQGCRDRAHMDVFMACPEKKRGTPLADRSHCWSGTKTAQTPDLYEAST